MTDEAFPGEPPGDCPRCPRLVDYRTLNRIKVPQAHNAPVPSFGPDDARALIVGLAPGVAGANRTGRPFTGDWAGDLLYETLDLFGFSSGRYDERPDDGLRLIDCMVTNAVRCAPPANKPTPLETRTCRDFLAARVRALPHLVAVVALGRIAHDSIVRLSGQSLAATPFGHGRTHDLPVEGRILRLFDSYHCSRYNTNTGVLTTPMFREVFAAVRTHLDASSDGAR